MDREILIRGKQKYDGKWVYGDLIDELYGLVIQYKENSRRIKTTIFPETVGQYTGLIDKNGKKIFEGDILSTTNANSRIWFVVFKLGAFCINQGNALNYSCELGAFMKDETVEVIGNIYDNSELLEV